MFAFVSRLPGYKDKVAEINEIETDEVTDPYRQAGVGGANKDWAIYSEPGVIAVFNFLWRNKVHMYETFVLRKR